MEDGDGAEPLSAPPEGVEVILLTSPDCHLCNDAALALEELASEFLLRVRVIEVGSATGRELVSTHRPPMQPAVLVEGRLFSSGRLPRKKLRRLLEGTA